MINKPIFEIQYNNNHYKIYENGKIEGFPEGGLVVNRIQATMAERIAKWIESAKNQWDESNKELKSLTSPAKNAKLSIDGCSQGTPS
jgi:hypothetical protein